MIVAGGNERVTSFAIIRDILVTPYCSVFPRVRLKCGEIPCQRVEYLGFIVDTGEQAFIIPPREIASFAALRE